MLFKRYASPLELIEGMIQTGQFSDFVDNLVQTVNEEEEEKTMWEFFLHKTFMYEGSFNDFKKQAEIDRKNQTMTKTEIETVYKQSMDILDNFKPE